MRSLSIAAVVLLLLPTACADAPKYPLEPGDGGGEAGAGGTVLSGGSGGVGAASGKSSTGGAGASAGGSAGTSAGAGGSAGASVGDGGNAGDLGDGGSDGGGAMHWVGTWATGNQVVEPDNRPSPTEIANHTIRQIVRVSIGGSQLRLRLSNEYGTAPVTMNAVHVAKPTTGSSIDTASDVALKFADSESVTIAAGQTATSDPFDFPLEPLSKVAITIALGARSGEYSGHPGSRTTSYIQEGNLAGAASISGSVTDHWYYIGNIDVMAPTTTRAIAILGDSITDGRGSTTNGNDRWPDVLASRLQADATKRNIAVLNLGIGGNNIVMGGLGPAGRTRFDSQILGQSGVKWVVVLEGVNDIGSAGTPAAQIISAYEEVVEKARAAGHLIYGIPILPFAGHAYDQGDNQTDRTNVNAFIRADGNFDAVLDLEATVSDGLTPPGLKTDLDYQDDRLHLNPTGYAALANAIDLSLFTP